MPQEKAITPINGQWLLTPDSDNLRCPYQASVMKTLLSMSNKMVYSPFILFLCERTAKRTILTVNIRPCSGQHVDRHP